MSGFLCCCFRPLKRSKSIRRHRWSSAFEDGPIVFVPALAGRNETIVFRFRVRFSVSGIFRCHSHAQTCGGGGAHVPRGGCDEGSNEVFASLAYRWQTVNKHIVMDACLIIPTPFSFHSLADHQPAFPKLGRLAASVSFEPIPEAPIERHAHFPLSSTKQQTVGERS